MSHFTDPRDRVSRRRTRTRQQLTTKLRHAARESRERRAAELELGKHDPDRLHELVGAANDAAAARAADTTPDDETLVDDLDPTDATAVDTELSLPSFGDVFE